MSVSIVDMQPVRRRTSNRIYPQNSMHPARACLLTSTCGRSWTHFIDSLHDYPNKCPFNIVSEDGERVPCPRAFNSPSQLTRHKQRAHEDETPPSPKKASQKSHKELRNVTTIACPNREEPSTSVAVHNILSMLKPSTQSAPGAVVPSNSSPVVRSSPVKQEQPDAIALWPEPSLYNGFCVSATSPKQLKGEPLGNTQYLGRHHHRFHPYYYQPYPWHALRLQQAYGVASSAGAYGLPILNAIQLPQGLPSCSNVSGFGG